MVSDEVGKQLHDRATRGEILSADEKAQLGDWYKAQDEAEATQLGLNINARPAAAMQAQINSALAQLVSATERIETITKENEDLRRENAELRRRLGSPSIVQRLPDATVMNSGTERKGVTTLVEQVAQEIMKRRNITFDDALSYILEEGALELRLNGYESAIRHDEREGERKGVA